MEHINMEHMKQEFGVKCQSHEELFELVMDAVEPWVLANRDVRDLKNWRIQSISQNQDQLCICIMHARRRDQFTALVCCLGEPEIVAVSFTSGNLGMLNPYLDCGHKLAHDLDGPGCWNVLAITFAAEPGAEAVRFLRRGKVEEVHINQFGAFSIVDWDNNQPVDEYLGVKINGRWKQPVVSAIPYTIDYITACWRRAVLRRDDMASRWNRWITAAFVELCGADRAILQHQMMNTLASEKNQAFYQAFKQERRKFLTREKQPLGRLLSQN